MNQVMMMKNEKIYFCATHNKYEVGKLPCGKNKRKPYCRYRFTKKIADKTGQLKLLFINTYMKKF